MKKSIYILLTAISLNIAVTSCQKEDIKPQVQTEQTLQKSDCCGENGTLPPDDKKDG